MCSSYLMTNEDAVKQRFNCETIDISQLKCFVGYYLCILQLAFEYQFISEKERNVFSEMILRAIYVEAHDDIIVVSNYNYVISLWLQSMSKYDAWKRISSISCMDDAKKFTQEAKEWFLKNVESILSIAKEANEIAVQISDKALIELSNQVMQLVSNFWKAFEEGIASDCNLKSLHKERSTYIGYDFLGEEDIYCTSNYFEKVAVFVRKFRMEIGILQKIASSELVSAIHEQDEKMAIQKERERQTKLELERKKIDKKIKELQAQLDSLNENYSKRLTSFISYEEAEEARVLEMEEKFRKEHPELDEIEMEEALDIYFANEYEYMDENPYDDPSIELEYSERKAELEEEIDELRNQNEETLNDIALSASRIFRPIMTLIKVAKEYVIFDKSQRGEMKYPTRYKQKDAVFSSISTREATSFLLRSVDRFNFSTEEITYLSSYQ